MRSQRIGRVLALLVVASVVPTASAQKPTAGRVFGELLKRLPDQTNALLLINADGLFDSPIGKRDKWRELAAENKDSGAGLPTNTSKAAIAMGINYATGNDRWSVGMIKINGEPADAETIASREGGYVETIENMPVAWTPRGFSLFKFPDGLVGYVAPNDRQSIVEWIRGSLSKPREFPPGFASRAVFRADEGAQVILALDLSNTASPKAIEPWLNAIDIIKKTKTDAALLAPRLASAKSAFLAITADQTLTAELRIDFDREVNYTGPVAKELILTVLDDYGAEIPEAKTWNLEFDPKMPSLTMRGRIGIESLRKVLTFAHPPQLSSRSSHANVTAPEPAKEKAEPTGPSKSDGLSASQGYYRSVTNAISGLKGTERPTYRSTRLWYDRYAKQVEELPILNVDKELLDWGAVVARTFREMSSGINGYVQNQNYTVASSTSGYYGGYGYNGYGYGYGGSRAYDQAVIKRQADSMMSVDLDKRWQLLETSVSDMRRKMVEKYNVDF